MSDLIKKLEVLAGDPAENPRGYQYSAVLMLEAAARIRELEARNKELVNTLHEVRRWIGDGDLSDGPLVELVDSMRFKKSTSETACDHDMQHHDNTIKPVRDTEFVGFYCTVCKERWGHKHEGSRL